jgi:MinD-like ATPase involved in chromosome partitioning or flagellar assembly
MTLIVLVSAKHSPGVTTAGLAFVTAWSTDHDAVLIEADPAGADVATRLVVPSDPGLVSLAAARRHGAHAAGALHRHLHPLPVGGSVLLAPSAPDQSASAFGSVAPGVLAELATGPGLAVIDCGRFAPGSAARLALRAAELVLVVSRPSVDDVVHVRSRLDALVSDAGDRLGVLLIGERPYGAAEVEAAVGVRVAGILADDPRGAASLYQAATPAAARRILVVRSARSFLERTVPLIASLKAVTA